MIELSNNIEERYIFMAQTMIRWRLAEIMARYKIRGVDLAKYLNVRANAVSTLKNADTMPRIDGEKLDQICHGLTILSGAEVRPSDLIEFDFNQEALQNAIAE